MDKMTTLLRLSPHGTVLCSDLKTKGYASFADSEPAALVQLSGNRLPAESDASVQFWREFTARFIQEICHIPESEEADSRHIEPPTEADLHTIILNAPPMSGAEYLSLDHLRAIWQRLDEWTIQERDKLGGIAAFLETHAPKWSRVGRVTLHLAENKADPEYPFAFMATYASELSKSGRVKQQPLSKALKEYAGAGDKPMLRKLLEPVQAAAKKNELMADLVETGDLFHPMEWIPEDAYDFLRGVQDYEEAGLLVRLPNWWKKRSRPQVAVTIGEQKKSKLGINALLDFNVSIVIDGRRLSREEVEALLANDDGLVMMRGQWIEVDREKLQQALQHWESIQQNGSLSFAAGMRLLAGAPANLKSAEELEEHREWAFTEPGEWLKETLEQLKNPDNLEPPQSLQATLRPYQHIGLNWLWFCANTGLGACLADDMGLGKTIQVLAALLRKKEEGADSAPAVLVVPASLVGNWKREAQKFAPSLKLFIAHRSESPKETFDALEADPQTQLKGVDLVITTYGMLTRMQWPHSMNWSWAILDEAQAIKNAGTRQSKAARELQAAARVVLTGTPVENRLGDLWALFDFINPGLLGNASQFNAFTKKISTENHAHYAPLRRLVSPYIMRRLKTDKSIISDLPDKTEMKVFCGLSTQQAKLYKKAAAELIRELKAEQEEGIQRKGLVLNYLMRFKQICNHPSQLTGDGDYDGKHSGKFRRLETLCGEIASRGEKVLVFTQFREITDALSEFLADIFGQSGLVLHGGTTVKKRQQMVNEFQQEQGPPFFVLSIKAGGTGLNLTEASHVIHFDRWWNPAIENQATDRAFRIGQKRNVVVHKFVTSGTLEEKIDRLLTEKQYVADQIMEQGAEKSLTEMSNDELMNMVALDIERAEI